ncbi:MAG: hypothetical protein ABI181_15025, partial [Mycobacteriaceae bacterium]
MVPRRTVAASALLLNPVGPPRKLGDSEARTEQLKVAVPRVLIAGNRGGRVHRLHRHGRGPETNRG